MKAIIYILVSIKIQLFMLEPLYKEYYLYLCASK